MFHQDQKLMKIYDLLVINLSIIKISYYLILINFSFKNILKIMSIIPKYQFFTYFSKNH